jgi:hypothetical protein
MKTLIRIAVALVVEGTAAILVAGLLLHSSSGETGDSPDGAMTAAVSRISSGAQSTTEWLRDALSMHPTGGLGDFAGGEGRSETDVAARLDHAAADLGASLERELDRVMQPFTERAPAAAARSD